MVTSLKGMLYFYQMPDMTNGEYLKKFKARVELMDVYNACILGKFPCLIAKKMHKMQL